VTDAGSIPAASTIGPFHSVPSDLNLSRLVHSPVSERSCVSDQAAKWPSSKALGFEGDLARSGFDEEVVSIGHTIFEQWRSHGGADARGHGRVLVRHGEFGNGQILGVQSGFLECDAKRSPRLEPIEISFLLDSFGSDLEETSRRNPSRSAPVGTPIVAVTRVEPRRRDS
jgi:hypothetical protein